MILPSINKQAWILWMILIGHLLIKLTAVPSLSIWGDEAYTIFYSQQSLGDLNDQLGLESNPPFYFYLLHFWIKLFGIDEFSVKSLSILFSVGTAFFVYRIGQSIQSNNVAILASLLFLFSNLHFDFSHEVRAYSLVCLEVTASFYLFIKYVQKWELSHLIWLTLINVLIAYTHYIALFVPLIQFAIIWIFNPNKSNVKRIVLGYFCSFLLFSPYLFIMLTNVPDSTFWLEKPSWSELNYVIFKLVGCDPGFYFIFIPFLLSPLVLIKRIRTQLFNSELKVKLVILLFIWFFLPIVLDYLFAQWKPIFRLRYVLFSSFGIYLSLAYLIWNLRISELRRYIISGAYILMFLWFFIPVNRSAEYWKTTAQLIKMGQNEHSATLVCANYKLNDLAYYFDRAAFADYKNTFKRLEKKQIFAITDTTDINNIKNISHYNRLNLVLSHNLITDPNRSIEEYFINNSYKKCEEFGGDENIKILTYKPNRIECEKLIEVSSTNMDLHCFTWKRTQFHDTETQSDIIEYKLVVEIPRKCNTNGPDHILNEVKIPGYYINNENPFSPTFKKKLNNELKIHYSGSFSGKSSNNAMFILTIASGNKIQHIDTHYLKGLIKPDEINEIAFSSLVPNNLPEDSELRIFLWNPGSEIVIMSNLSIQLWDSFQ